MFLDEANSRGLAAPRKVVSALIETAVNEVAVRMSITPVTARKYFTDDDVRALVHSAAESMSAEAPGAQLSDLDPTHTVPTALAGRTVAGLAIITELAASVGLGSEKADLVHELAQTLSLITAWGISIETAAKAGRHVGAVHEAAIHRTIREFERGKAYLAEGIVPLDGGDPNALAHAFDENVAALRGEL